MPTRTIHVFVASFESEDAARAYSEPQWEPEPAEDARDEEYEAWEDRNPSCLMTQDLGGIYLDEDFIETIWGMHGRGDGANWPYLASVIGEANGHFCENVAVGKANTLILIDAQAAGGFPVDFRSTPAMTYCGPFPPLS